MTVKTAAKPAAKAAPMAFGKMIDVYWATREEKRRLQAELKEIEAKLEEFEGQLFERLDAEGMEKGTGTKASISISSNTVAKVDDWDEFWKFIIKNKFTHLLQRRVSDPAYRELVEAGKKVPGVVPFIKRTLNLRSL